MRYWEHYHRATNLKDALEALSGAPGASSPIAGGTDLLLDIQQGRHAPVHTLVDISDVSEMNVIEERAGELFIGAAVPLNHIIRSEQIQRHAMALVEASELIGGPQVRNTASLGGNVAHALPAGDGTIALMALNAQAEVADLQGERREGLENLFLGPGKSSLDLKRELIVGFYLPLHNPGEGSAFRRVMRPQGVALPILNMAVWLRREAGLIADVRLGVGPSGPTPRRSRQAEASLRGRELSEVVINQAGEALLSEANYRTSPYRASAEYRQELTGSLFEDTVRSAWERAAGES
jgi:carbon-monoxide dehydrogenase medium subunit